MTGPQHDDLLGPADFEALFAGEPGAPDPSADLQRGRSRRHRGRLARGAVAAVAVVAVGTVAGSVLSTSTSGAPVGPAGGFTAVPSPAPSTSSPTPSADPTPSGDTAPALKWDERRGYLDRDGQALSADARSTPFRATTKSSWELARDHLDPLRRHLEAYQPSAFSGGSAGSGGIQVGQKLGWTVGGDAGQGMVQLAVTRLVSGQRPQLGPGHDDADGFCNDLYTDGVCKKITVDGVQVWVADTSDGGFVMDRLQADGEIASIVVSPLFGNNTDVAVKSMGITKSQAVALLDDPALDVVG